ncbi:MAG: cobalamin-dependent protein [Pseudomonadota bacterium]
MTTLDAYDMRGAHDVVGDLSADRARQVERFVEGEIVPRMMLAKQRFAAAAIPAEISSVDVALFEESVLWLSAAEADAFVLKLIGRGVPRDAVLTDLLAVAARNIGARWEADLVTFVDVSVAMTRIHHVLRTATRMTPGWPAGAGGRSVLLGVLCEDTHIFGLALVADAFRNAGWRVSYRPDASAADLAKETRRKPYDAVGLSASCDQPTKRVSEEIAALRRTSVNQDLKVFVGGRLFGDDEELAFSVGADGLSSDAFGAPVLADRLVAAQAALC